VPGVEMVVIALLAPRETADAAFPAESVELFVSSGYQLVRVALMTDVPDDFVMGEVEDFVERESKLHDAQVGRQMTAVCRDDRHDFFPYLAGEDFHLLFGEIFQVGRAFYIFKQRHG